MVLEEKLANNVQRLFKSYQLYSFSLTITGKTKANEDVAPSRNICCGHKFCVRDTKNVSDFVQKHFVSATNVSQFARPRNIMSNNVSSFARALMFR